MKVVHYDLNETHAVWQRHSRLGEGPIWWNNQLYWVDILAGELLGFEPSSGKKQCWQAGQMIGTVVPCKTGRLLLATESGLMTFYPENQTFKIEESPVSKHIKGRFNDGKCDPLGNLFAGTIVSNKGASLYRINQNFDYTELLSGVTVSNGLAWYSSFFYYIDTQTQRVDVFDYDIDRGDIKNQRIAFSLEAFEGYPDGMTIDSDGNLWIAFYDGQCVRCFERESGICLCKISLPVPRVTACWFGGDVLNDLYITTAREGLSKEELEKYPFSGSLFKITLPYRGLPTNSFGR